MRTRKNRWEFRLNDLEDIKFRDLLKATGYNGNQMFRSMVMNTEIKTRPPDLAPKILREISAIGNNVNQIAKVANYSKNVPNEDIKELKEMNVTLKELSKKVRDM